MFGSLLRYLFFLYHQDLLHLLGIGLIRLVIGVLGRYNTVTGSHRERNACKHSEFNARAHNFVETKTDCLHTNSDMFFKIGCKVTKKKWNTQARARFFYFFLISLAHFKNFLYLCSQIRKY